MLNRHPGERARRVILLSDGEANTGITDPASFAALSRSIVGERAVLSTIGLGLGFNETLMAALADHGMGNYSYLEQLASLDTILKKDLRNVQSQYASESTLELTLPAGAQIADASGYPFERAGGDSYRIATGQLAGGSKRSFFVTFTVPTESIGSVSPLRAALQYRTPEGVSTAALSGMELALAIVPPQNVEEIRAAVRADVFSRAWTKNELGLMKRKLSDALRAGNKDGAEAALVSYRNAVSQAEAASNVSLNREELEQEMKSLDAAVGDAFSGPASEMAAKQNRAAKMNHSAAIADQRAQ
jgi:Ca-activated chloride channel family protein